MLTSLMNSLGYLTERILDNNEDTQALKVLTMAFEWYLRKNFGSEEGAASLGKTRLIW
jgi:hypothetical protein